MRIATARASRSAAVLLALSLLASLVPAAAFAAPSTPEIEAKQAEASVAQAELERMNAELEVQIEEYNAITESLDFTREDIRVTAEQLECAKQDLTEASTTLSERATSIYKRGGTSMLEVFLGARTFDDFMALLDLAVRINRSDAEMVVGVKEAKARVESTALALEQRQAEQMALQSEASARAASIEANVVAQERFVSGLNGEVRSLIAAEEERQRLLAAERARQAALAAANRSKSSAGDRAASDPSALGSGHPEVVTVALGYLGVPYVWGGSSPSGFDCSGLTQYCYRQIGISLPRTSQSQYQTGQHIARDRLDLLKPGDLVFFGTGGDGDRVHHVGMYVGDGNYVHAPYTGTLVRVDSLTARISSRGDYVGASRL
ncbi:MAG: NlpC/P60 family protein [Coriobacteriia bacterium]|nr:NlpC/P60 family protein [Coriobacteriia bacterium]